MVVHIVSFLSLFVVLSSPADACTVHVHRGAMPYVFLQDNTPSAWPAKRNPPDFPLGSVITEYPGSPWIERADDTASWHPKDVDLRGADCPDLSKMPRHPTLLR